MSGFIGLICTLMLICGFVFMFVEEARIGGIIATLVALFGIYACSTNPTLERERAEQAAIDEKNNIECRKPQVVSEIDGVRLYKYRPTCNCSDRDVVYFSKSGTQSTKCHQSGKTTICEPERVPNND